MNGYIGSHWSRVALRRLFDIRNGGTPTAHAVNWEGGVTWVTPADLRTVHGATITSSSRTVSEEGLASSNAVLSPAGSIVVSTRAPIGYVAIAAVDLATNQGCRTLVPKADLDVRFFAYQLMSLEDELQVRGRGTTFMELSSEALASLRVVAPPVSTQTRVADYLDRETSRIDSIFNKNGRMLSLLAERRAAWLRGVIEHAAGGLAGWVRLKHLAQGVTVGIVVQPARLYVDQGGVPALRGVNIGPGQVTDADLVRISHEANEGHRKSLLQSGDVVIVRTGKAGAAAVVPDWAVGGNCIDLLLVSPGEKLRPKFVEMFLNSEEAVRQVTEGVVGAIQGHLNVGTLRELRVPRLTLEQQDRLVSEVESFDASTSRIVTALERQNELLAERRAALITAAVTGQLDVQEAA